MIETFLIALRWQDAVDILLNSYILFRLFILLRGTRLSRVLTIVLLFFILQRISFSVGLIITSWVMQGITALAAILVIIVFRSEIRTVFQAKNVGDILWRIPQQSLDTPLDTLASAVFDLARNRTGAIIVLPGYQDLEGIAYGGIPWNGRLSKEMIRSIFWPGSPVHDGAAIVTGDQVSEVGAILPLSIRSDLPSHYGTRHRAALGLSDQTDATVIVVSEERGDVTVTRKDTLTPAPTPEDLHGILDDHTGYGRWGSGKDNTGHLQIGAAAIASFLIVCTIWFSFSTGGSEALATLNVPVEYINRNPSMLILQTSNSTVEIQMSGPKTLVQSISVDQIKVRFDLSDAVTGTNILTVGQNNVTHPPGVKLKQITPETIRLDLDITARKQLPIQVDWTGKLPEGMLISGAEVVPDTAEIIGAKGIVEGLSTLYTVKVQVDDLTPRGELSIPLALRPASVSLASPAGNRVRIRYTMSKREPVEDLP